MIRASRSAATLAVALLMASSGSAAAGEVTSGSSPEPAGRHLAAEWIDATGRFFQAHPELRAPRGSTWKHFVKIRHFVETRTIDSRLPTAAERYRAWEVGQARRPALRGGGWFTLGPDNISGRIVDLKFHPTAPSILYAASASGGLWLSSDNGFTWRTTTDQLPSLAIGAVCVIPTNPDVVLIATGEGIHWSYVVYGTGIWKSTDAGETWAQTSLSHTVTDNHGFHVMEANPFTGTVLAGANDGLWRSTDEGDTWTQVKIGDDYYDVKWKPGSATRVYATKGGGASGNNVKVSTNDGLTWGRAGVGQPSSDLISKTRLAVTPADPTVIYAHYGNSQTYGTLGIYRSTDDGVSWTARNTTLNISGTQGSYANTIAVSPTDTERVVSGGIELYLSTNGGLTFDKTGDGNPLGDESSVHWDHHAIVWEPGTGALWVGNDGGAWRSTDEGSTWSARRDGLVTTQYYDVCVAPSDPSLVIGGSQDNGNTVLEVDDTWLLSTLVADGFACHFEPLDPVTIYSEWQFGGRVKSTNGALSWFPIQSGISGNSRAFTPLELDRNTVGRLFTSTIDDVYRTTNGGNLWTPVATHEATWISVSPVDGQVVWTVDGITGGAPVRVSTNGGTSWTAAAPYGFAVGNETRILAHPTNPAAAFVTFAAYAGPAHVAATTDHGASWFDVSGDFPPDPANTIAVDPLDADHWFVGTDTGVWYSDSGGTVWAPLAPGFPNTIVHDLEIQAAARKLIAGTYGRGVWEIDLPSPSGTDVAIAPRSRDLMLDPPAPNPVRGRAWVRYASKRPGRLVVDVHDVRGARVARIVDGVGGDGIVRVAEWRPENAPSGVYFLTLRSGGETLTRKLVLER